MYIKEQGDVDVLTYGDLPDPIVKSNEIKIKVKACSINRLDLFARSGETGVRLNLKTPHVLGGDVAGDVIESGDMVTDFLVGDRVVINPHVSCRKCKNCKLGEEGLCLQSKFLGMTSNGGYAEYITIPFYNVVRIPDNLSYIEAAAIPTVFIPCWNMLFRKANLQPNEKVLVVSASSGIGTAAIQLAKNILGVKIVATTSNLYKAQLIKEMGVNDVLLHTDENLNNKLMEITNNEGFNVVIDHVGLESWSYGIQALAKGGRYCVCGVTSGHKVNLHLGSLFKNSQTVFGVFMGTMADLQNVINLISNKKIKPVIADTIPLKEVKRAHKMLEEKSIVGKLVITF